MPRDDGKAVCYYLKFLARDRKDQAIFVSDWIKWDICKISKDHQANDSYDDKYFRELFFWNLSGMDNHDKRTCKVNKVTVDQMSIYFYYYFLIDSMNNIALNFS